MGSFMISTTLVRPAFSTSNSCKIQPGCHNVVKDDSDSDDDKSIKIPRSSVVNDVPLFQNSFE